MYIPQGRASQKRSKGVSWIRTDKHLGGGGELVWVDGARSMINRPDRYSSCWRSEVWLHRWKWVGRSRAWWWFMSAGQMFHSGEGRFDKRLWKSPPGEWARTSNIHSNEPVFDTSSAATTRDFQVVSADRWGRFKRRNRFAREKFDEFTSENQKPLAVLLIRTACPVAGQVKHMQVMKRGDK